VTLALIVANPTIADAPTHIPSAKTHGGALPLTSH